MVASKRRKQYKNDVYELGLMEMIYKTFPFFHLLLVDNMFLKWTEGSENSVKFKKLFDFEIDLFVFLKGNSNLKL